MLTSLVRSAVLSAGLVAAVLLACLVLVETRAYATGFPEFCASASCESDKCEKHNDPCLAPCTVCTCSWGPWGKKCR